MKSLLVVMTLVAATQQPATNKQRYEKFLEQANQRLINQTEAKIDKTEKRLDSLKKRKTRGKAEKQAVRERKKAVRDQIKEHKRYLTKLQLEKKNKRFTQSGVGDILHPTNLYVGLICAFHGDRLDVPLKSQYYDSQHVLQIFDEHTMLVYTFRNWVWKQAWYVPRELRTQPVLLKGLSTRGMVNEQKLELVGKYFEVTGTQQYATASGSTNTVFVLEPFDMTGITP